MEIMIIYTAADMIQTWNEIEFSEFHCTFPIHNVNENEREFEELSRTIDGEKEVEIPVYYTTKIFKIKRQVMMKTIMLIPQWM